MPRLVALGLVCMCGLMLPQLPGIAVARELAAILPPRNAGKGFLPRLSTQTDPDEALLAKIAAWLSENFKLPASKTLPAIVVVPQARMAKLRHRYTVSPSGRPAASGEEPGSIVALYDPLRWSIYLPEGWRGDTPTEVSILVHEMVHFLQDIARQTFGCPQARERLAYAAQERWLGLSGHSLAEDFEVDAFTLLVRTGCLH